MPSACDAMLPDWDPARIAAGTADPAFVSDELGLITSWNESAEELLGYPAEDVVGRPCYEVLCGRDTFGNRFCDEECAIKRMAQKSEPARLFVLDMRDASSQRVSVRVSVLRLPAAEPSRFFLVHTLLPVGLSTGLGSGDSSAHDAGATLAAADEQSISEQARIRSLTPRETEVLRLLAAGNASQDVANELFISLTTVRTHIQNILRKLEVHSQLEAVALAFKRGLI